jgi:hypothetical protein
MERPSWQTGHPQHGPEYCLIADVAVNQRVIFPGKNKGVWIL